MIKVFSIAALVAVSAAANSQGISQEMPLNTAAPLLSTQTAPPIPATAVVHVARTTTVLPANTLMMVTPLNEITSLRWTA